MGVPLLLFSKQQKKKSITYSDRILSLSPLAYWPLNETSGTKAIDLVGAHNGAYTGVDLAQSQPPFIAPYFDGANDFCNVYSAWLNTNFNGSEGSFSLWAKISSAGIWTDGANRTLVKFSAGANELYLRRTTTNNQLQWVYVAGGVTDAITSIALGGNIGWMHLAFTWSKSGEIVTAYGNGAVINTSTTLGAWAGALTNTGCVIGAGNITPTVVWSGWIAQPALWNRALSAAEVANLYAWGV
jgi:hypothetical protein